MTKYLLLGAMIAILLSAIGGFWFGTKHTDSDLQKQISTLNTTVATYRAQIQSDKQTYDANLNTWKAKEADIANQYNELLGQTPTVVTRTVIKEVHDHPAQYQCVIPASGWKAIFDQASQLNGIRGE